MEFLSCHQILMEASNCGNGRYIRLGYSKELPVTDAWREKGIRIYKLTETTVRLGVNYRNLASVKAREDVPAKPSTRTNNWEWVLPSKVKYNKNTNKMYLQVYTVKGGHNTKNTFLIHTPGEGWITLEKPEYELSEYSLMVDPKYTSSSNSTDIYTVTFDKIYKLGNALA